MTDFKIVFSGPSGTGKTAAINAISDTPSVRTDKWAGSQITAQGDNSHMLNYGMIQLNAGEHIELYGTTGQGEFHFISDILTNSGIGLILLMDNTRADPFHDMQFYLDGMKEFIDLRHVVIGVTKMDQVPKPSIKDYHLQLEDQSIKIPIFEVDTQEQKEIALLVEALLYLMDPGV